LPLNRTKLLAVLAVVAVAALAWDRWGGAGPGPAASAPASAGAASGNASTGGGAFSIGGAPSSAGSASGANFLRPAAAATPTVSTLARDFTAATQYKPLLDRLNGTPEGNTPEGQYYLYQILRACATIADRRGGSWASMRASQLEERRQLVATEIAEGDARRAQRLAAIDQLSADKCAGIGGISMTEAEVNQLLRNSLAGGDPKARALTVEQELWRERRGAGADGRAGATLSEAQVASLRESLSSRDPEALVIAGRVLANAFRDATVRIGPDQEPIDNRSFGAAALLLACEYGHPCGNNHPRVLNACAYQGQCGAATLADYLFYYGASPYEAQTIDRYRTLLRQSADSGDWSSLVVQRGTRSPNAPPPGWPPAR
jgi:hypothetical protein